ncbi:hypothetical protein M0Q50_08885 [bacterium]|jgi:hypothetical protein|nr:hypothetical protein [bacterium]
MKTNKYTFLVDEHLVLHIFPSGWKNPQKYFVVLEDGETSDYGIGLSTKNDILGMYKINIEDEIKKFERIDKINTL